MRRFYDAGAVSARAIVAVWCILTAVYAFVASSPFAYAQFIKPRVFAGVGRFADWHAWFTWCALAALLAALGADRERAKAPTLRGAGAAAAFGFAIWNTWHPVVPALSAGRGSVLFGAAALSPLLLLAAVDHVSHWRWLCRRRRPQSELEQRGAEGRWLVASFTAAGVLTLAYVAVGAFRLAFAFEPDLHTAAVATAVIVTLADATVLAGALFVSLALAGRLLRGRFAFHYAVAVGMAAAAGGAFLQALLTSALGMGASDGWLSGLAIAVVVSCAWAGASLGRAAAALEDIDDPLDVLFPRYAGRAGLRRAALRVILLFPLAAALAAASAVIDWDFVILKLGVAIVGLTTLRAVLRLTPPRPAVGASAAAAACLVPAAILALRPFDPIDPRTLKRYAVHNPATYVLEALVRPEPSTPAFDRFLRANTGLTATAVAPIDIDHVRGALGQPARTPHIFLLVVDSLRADYLSAYNPKVTFTPHLQAIATEGMAFRRSFTRYGGTGVSMPALWAGSAVAHKQYVLPFQPMNALEKLLDAGGYRRVMGRDHITEALWRQQPGDIEIDRGRPEMEFDLCRTLDEMAAVAVKEAPAGPLFMQTRALNLHVASVRYGYVPPGKSYPGFEASYAYRVERMDGCVGEFVARLTALNLYDRSLVVITSDHGELTGEDGRWGHSYHMFPPVVQTPLIMHFPKEVREPGADTDAVALSTDIVPTLYRALGYSPVTAGSLAGRSLIGASADEIDVRRRGYHVLAASYGAVYAVVSRNGTELYIADAIKGTDFRFRRATGPEWREVPVDAATRSLGQLRIVRFIDEIARDYRLPTTF